MSVISDICFRSRFSRRSAFAFLCLLRRVFPFGVALERFGFLIFFIPPRKFIAAGGRSRSRDIAAWKGFLHPGPAFAGNQAPWAPKDKRPVWRAKTPERVFCGAKSAPFLSMDLQYRARRSRALERHFAEARRPPVGLDRVLRVLSTWKGPLFSLNLGIKTP